jgi:tripartite-type tricarboxylate transporter receptor subunit TctC
MKVSSAFIWVIASFCLLGFGPAHSAAASEADFFRDKVVRLVVGGGAGGGYDIYARMMAPHLEKRLGTKVIVENRPGAGMLIAMNHVYQAPPDGLTLILAPAEGAVLGKMLDEAGARYDLKNFPILARVNSAPRALLVNPKSRFQSAADMASSPTPIWFSVNGKTDGVADTIAVMCHAMKLQCKLAIGYQSSKTIALAVINGEADATVLVDDTSVNYTKGLQLKSLFFVGRDRSTLMPDTPSLFEVASLDAEATWWLDFREDLRRLGRVLMVPPGINAERLAFLRQTIREILNDADIKAEFASKGQPIQFASPDEVEAIINGLLGDKISPERLREIRHVILDKYY